MSDKNIVEIIGSKNPSEKEKAREMVCLPILNFGISNVFNEQMIKNLHFKLEINTKVPAGFGADVQVFTEPSDKWSYGFLLRTEELRPQSSEIDMKLNWQLLQNIFNCYTINLLIIRMKLDGRLEEKNGREYWLGEDVTDIIMDDLPYMAIAKEELEEKFDRFIYWIQEHMSEAFK